MFQTTKILFVHGQIESFTVRRGYTLKQGLNDNKIKFQHDYNNYYVLGDNVLRTGKVFSLLNVVPTNEPETI